jgi:hypothetical protein
MFEAYQYTAVDGIALREDYAYDYKQAKGSCKRGFKAHFKNTD